MSERSVSRQQQQKQWYDVLAPEQFDRAELGETVADEPDKVLGRTIETTLGDIRNDASENNTKLEFRITEVASDSAYTEFIKHELTRDYLRSLVRRGSSKVEAYITVLTTDDYRIQVQPVALTTKQADASQKKAIRRTMIDLVEEAGAERTFEDLLDSIVEGRLSSAIYSEAKTVYPLRRVEVAKALAAREAELDTRVHCLVYGAEEVGLVGSTHDAGVRDHDAIKAIVNNDGAARGRTLKLYTHGFDDLADAAATVGDRFDHPINTVPRLGPHSDHWPYVQRGVPGYHVMSETGTEGRGWGHTFADTLDKLEKRDLREQAILLAELAVELADDETAVGRREPEAIAAQLEDEDLAEGMKVIGDWPY
jgi:ribosomal protein S3AE